MKKLRINNIHPCIEDVLNSIISEGIDTQKINAKKKKHDKESRFLIKEEILDFLMLYIELILSDNSLTKSELATLTTLKKVFKINEGDFYQLKKNEIQSVLSNQLQKMYLDSKVDSSEELYNVSLQELFDLSYDQYQELCKIEIQKALDKGANLSDLDTTLNL